MVAEFGLVQNINPFEHFDSDRPLPPEQLAEIYPFMLRKIIPPRESTSVFRFQPQSGEHERFGVFFWALMDLAEQQRLKPTDNKLMLLLKTAELLSGKTMDPEVLSRGVVVCPSKTYQNLRLEACSRVRAENGQYDPKSLGFNYAVESQVHKSYAVLDIGVIKTGCLPILSIPCMVCIDKDFLISPPRGQRVS